MAKAKPIRDMNGSQWNRYEREAIKAIKAEPRSSNQDLAISALDAVHGRVNKGGDLVPPSGGYTTELVDGATRLVEVRRKQIGDLS